MWKQGKKSQIYGTEILQMSIWRDLKCRVKYPKTKYFWCQYEETTKRKSNIQKWNTAVVNTQRKPKQIEIYTTEKLQMLILKTRKTKSNNQNWNTADVIIQRWGNQVKYTELKNCRCEYAEARRAKWNLWNWNTADVHMQKRGKQTKIYGT